MNRNLNQEIRSAFTFRLSPCTQETRELRWLMTSSGDRSVEAGKVQRLRQLGRVRWQRLRGVGCGGDWGSDGFGDIEDDSEHRLLDGAVVDMEGFLVVLKRDPGSPTATTTSLCTFLSCLDLQGPGPQTPPPPPPLAVFIPNSSFRLDFPSRSKGGGCIIGVASTISKSRRSPQTSPSSVFAHVGVSVGVC